MRGARKKGDRTGTRGMHSARDPRGTWHSVQVSNIRGETPNTAIPFPLSISQSCSLLDPPHSLPSLVSFLFWLNIAVSGERSISPFRFVSFVFYPSNSKLAPSFPLLVVVVVFLLLFFFVSFQVRTSPSKKLLLLPTNIPSPPPRRRRRRRRRRRGKKERRVEQVFLFFAFSKSRSCEVLTDNRGIRPFSCHKSRDSAQQ